MQRGQINNVLLIELLDVSPMGWCLSRYWRQMLLPIIVEDGKGKPPCIAVGEVDSYLTPGHIDPRIPTHASYPFLFLTFSSFFCKKFTPNSILKDDSLLCGVFEKYFVSFKNWYCLKKKLFPMIFRWQEVGAQVVC